MDWGASYASSYELAIVDSSSWLDMATLDMSACSIDRSNDSLRQSADITVPELYDDGTTTRRERWVRVYLCASQAGEHVRVPLFTGLESAPKRKYSDGVTSWSLECYSVLKPPSDVLLDLGWYAPAGTLAAQLAARLLRNGFCPAPIEVAEGSPSLSDAIVAEDDETCLTMAEKIVDAIGWALTIDGDGTVRIAPKPSDEAATFSPDSDVIVSSFEAVDDWFSAPNVFRAELDGEMAVARDDTSTELSTEARGREIWEREGSVKLGDSESLAGYAQRKLAEAQARPRKLSYDRRFVAGVGVGDIVRIGYPGHGIAGTWRVVSQSISCGVPCTVSEEVEGT